ncbi:MAG: hypothetical protein EA424_26790, partial [Planctomycetaceae bacterium]
MGKVINNTVYGGPSPSGIGIHITNAASPTVMNNIVANTATGISVDASSSGLPSQPDITTTLFQGNSTPGTQGTNAILAPPSAPLFVNPAAGNFYLAASQPGNPNRAIDSSLNTRVARLPYTQVTNPLGIPQQDMFAPKIDRFGQLRVDDPDTPNATGLGGNIYIDRGAIERADFTGPVARMVLPLDNDPAGIDRDSALTYMHIVPPEGSPPWTQFILEIVDVGIGVDHSLAGDKDRYALTRDGIPLVEGTDYFFAYNANSNRAIFTSASSFPLDAVYTITIDNTAAGIRDLAGNILSPNRTTGETAFTILLGGRYLDFGDAPDSYGTTLAQDGARHVLLPSIPLWLGAGVDPDPDGQPTSDATGDDRDYYVLVPEATRESGLRLMYQAPHTIQSPAAGGPGGVTANLPASIEIEDFNGNMVTLEFAQNAPMGGVNEIAYYDADSAETMGERIVQGINNATGLSGVSAINLNGGAVQIDGARDVSFEGGNLSPTNLLPAALRLRDNYATDGIDGIDGLTFTISDGVNVPVTFEFDNDLNTLTGTTVIEFTAGEDNLELVRRMVDVIGGALSNLEVYWSEPEPGTYQVHIVSLPLPGTTNRRDDEDGVVINGAFHTGVNNLTPITVTASGAGFLDAWVDFNGDGVFSLEEKIIDSQPVVAGANVFQVSTPTNAVLGSTFARFRVSPTGGLSPTGLAIGGEVEDYMIEIVSVAPPTAMPEEYTIDEDTLLDSLTYVDPTLSSVLNNDIPGSGALVEAVLVTPPVHAESFTLNPDGTFVYMPLPNFYGTDSFTYAARDAVLTSNNVAEVTIHVLPINDEPIIDLSAVPADLTIEENDPNGLAIHGIRIDDLDNIHGADDLLVEVSVWAENGTMSLPTAAMTERIVFPAFGNEVVRGTMGNNPGIPVAPENGDGGNRDEDHVLSGAGLVVVESGPNQGKLIHTAGLNDSTKWNLPQQTGGLLIQLPGDWTVEVLQIWNFNANTFEDWGADSFDLYLSTNATPPASLADMQLVQSNVPLQRLASYPAEYLGETFVSGTSSSNILPGEIGDVDGEKTLDNSGPITGRWLWLGNMSGAAGADRVGLSEIRLYGRPAASPQIVLLEGDGVRDETITFRGTLADVTGALDGLIYHPNPEYNSGNPNVVPSNIVPDLVHILVDDLGNVDKDTPGTPQGINPDVALTAHEVIPITVLPKQTPPTVDVSAAVGAALDEDTSLVLGPIVVDDVDAATDPLWQGQVTLSVSHGTLSLSQQSTTELIVLPDVSSAAVDGRNANGLGSVLPDGGAGSDHDQQFAVDGAGLSLNPFGYLIHATDDVSKSWRIAQQAGGLMIDLGAIYTIDVMQIWNYAVAGLEHYGPTEFDLWVSSVGDSLPISTAGMTRILQNVPLNPASDLDGDGYKGETYLLSGATESQIPLGLGDEDGIITDLSATPATGRFFFFGNLQGAPGAGHVGLSEVQFYGRQVGIPGLVFVQGVGMDDTTMTFRGSLADLNAALDGITYTPDPDYNSGNPNAVDEIPGYALSPEQLVVTINDLGN